MSVLYASEAELESKIAVMAGRPEALQIICDFDFTLTKLFIDGKKANSTHGVIEDNPKLGEVFQKGSKMFHDKYYPIEVDLTVPFDEKLKYMIEWWSGV